MSSDMVPGPHLFGRRLYEVMEDFWSSPERADGGEVEAEFAQAYVATPRIVFSRAFDLTPVEHRVFEASGWAFLRYRVNR